MVLSGRTATVVKGFRVETVEIWPERREVSGPDGPIALRAKTFQLLLLLVKHRDRVVSKQEILEEIWPGTVVSENSVAQCVIELRKALGDTSREEKWIRTVGKSGYRFAGPVEELETALVPEATKGSRRMLWAAGAVVMALAAAGMGMKGWKAGREEGRISAVSMTPNLKAAHNYMRGVELVRQSHAGEALKLFEEAVALDPEFAMAHARIGYAYSVAMSRLEEGKPHMEKAYALSGRLNDLSRLYILAWYSEANRDYSTAIRAFRELIERYPGEVEAMQQLGRVLAGERRFEEAEAVFLQALRVDPNSPQVHNSLSAAYIGHKRFDQGVAAAERFVELLPEEANAHDSLGLAYEAKNDFGRAEASYRNALAIKPGFGVARIHLANVLFRMGRYGEARAELEQYISGAASEHERARGLDELSVIASHRGKWAEAEAYAGKQPVGFHYEEIRLAIRRGDLGLAERLLAAQPEQADRGQRGNRRFRLVLLGELALARGQVEKGVAYFKEALAERTPFYAIDWYEDCLARAYLRLGRTEEAVKEFQRVVGDYPGLALAWHGLGKAHAARGELAMAREAYGKVVSLWKGADGEIPELVEAREAVARR